MTRPIALIGICSDRCNRRISAQSSTASTCSLPGSPAARVSGGGQLSAAARGSVFRRRRHGVPSPIGQPGRRREGASSADDTGAGRSRRSSPRPGKPVTWPRAAAGPQPKDWKAGRSPVNTGAPSPSPVNLAEAKGRVLGIQTKLHRWATADAGRRFDDLFNLVTDPAFLAVAWERVRTNRGARTAGVDGSTAYYIRSVRG